VKVDPIAEWNIITSSWDDCVARIDIEQERRTEVVGLTVRKLSPDLASCAGTFVRFNTGGQEITRLGFTYTMRNVGSWKIIVGVVHELVAA